MKNLVLTTATAIILSCSSIVTAETAPYTDNDSVKTYISEMYSDATNQDTIIVFSNHMFTVEDIKDLLGHDNKVTITNNIIVVDGRYKTVTIDLRPSIKIEDRKH